MILKFSYLCTGYLPIVDDRRNTIVKFRLHTVPVLYFSTETYFYNNTFWQKQNIIFGFGGKGLYA